MGVDRLSVAGYDSPHAALVAVLGEHGIEAAVVTGEGDLELDGRGVGRLHLVLLELSLLDDVELKSCLRKCGLMKLPAMGLVPGERLAGLDAGLGLDDFVVTPANPHEVLARARRALRRHREAGGFSMVRAGDLVINPDSFEVSLGGRRLALTFKEYELLRLLATNPGRVYSRETLLSRIWGYDYFGGTRTVDVHVRRLRSKMEDADHTFIETVWKAGYRFRPAHRPP